MMAVSKIASKGTAKWRSLCLLLMLLSSERTPNCFRNYVVNTRILGQTNTFRNGVINYVYNLLKTCTWRSAISDFLVDSLKYKYVCYKLSVFIRNTQIYTKSQFISSAIGYIVLISDTLAVVQDTFMIKVNMLPDMLPHYLISLNFTIQLFDIPYSGRSCMKDFMTVRKPKGKHQGVIERFCGRRPPWTLIRETDITTILQLSVGKHKFDSHEKIVFHLIDIYVVPSGGSTYKSFRRAPPPPPTGPNSFVFTYVFTEKHLCRRLVTPPTRVGAPPEQEILDPPLVPIRTESLGQKVSEDLKRFREGILSTEEFLYKNNELIATPPNSRYPEKKFVLSALLRYPRGSINLAQ